MKPRGCAGGAGATPSPPVRPPRRWSFAGWALALALLDQGVKAQVLRLGAEGLLPRDAGWAALAPSLNRGVAFSLGASGGWGSLLALGGLAALGALSARLRSSPLRCPELALLWGGALGNLTDRFLRGGVVDYLALRHPLPLPSLNLADLFLSAGALLLLADLLRPPGKDPSSAPPPG